VNETTELKSASNIALLAPVPLEHLVSALEVLATEEKVAFGSMAFLLFHDLDSKRHGLPVDVYIYASARETNPDASPFWRATYLKFVGSNESKPGSHPDGMKYRPKSTEKYALDNEGHWGIFWEVKDLRPATPKDWCPIAEMTGYGKKRRYGKPFVPEGPILIEHPGVKPTLMTPAAK
jgi:hypothetical protein